MVTNVKNHAVSDDVFYQMRKMFNRKRSPEAILRRKFLNCKRTQRNRKLYRETLKIPAIKQKTKQMDNGHIVSSTPATYIVNKDTKLFAFNNLYKIGTFNVRTLKADWRIFELIRFCIEYSVDILAIQEHKYIFDRSTEGNVKKRDLGKGWQFYYSSADINDIGGPIGGVGFIISPKAAKSIDSIISISSRILKCQFSASSNHKYTAFSIYSPTSVSNIDDINIFYNDLSESSDNIAGRNFQVILGDFNAQLIRSKSCLYRAEDYTKQTKLNRNSEMLDEFLFANDFLPINSRYKKPLHKLYTHTRPGSRQIVGLDHIMFKRKWSTSAFNCNVYPAPISSDHRPIIAIVKWRLQAHKIIAKRSVYYDWTTFYNTQNEVKLIDNVKSFHIDSNLSMEDNYKSLTTLINNSVQNFVPEQPRSSKPCLWEDCEISRLRTEKTNARAILKGLRPKSSDFNTAYTRFCEISKKHADMYTTKQIDYFSEKCEQVTKLNGEHKHSAAWNLINQITGRIVRKKGLVSADSPEEGVRLFHLHFEQLLSPNISNNSQPEEIPNLNPIFDKNFTFSVPFETGEITLDEITITSKQLSNGKATGIDNIHAEILKNPTILIQLLPFFNYALSNGIAFSDWKLSLIIPVPKKGDLSQPTNYRGIALMSIITKLYNRILLNRLKSTLDIHLRGNQNGFRASRSTLQHILALRRLTEECSIHQDLNLIAIFIDFSKAFDSVKWSYIEAILKAYCVPTILIRAIMSIYYGAKAQVNTQFGLSPDTIDLSVGVLQGDTLAPYLFIIVIDYIMREALINKNKLGFNINNSQPTSHMMESNPNSQYQTRNATGARKKNISIPEPSCEKNINDNYITDLNFADDLTILASTFQNAQELLYAIEAEALKVGLKINRPKTQYVVIGSLQPSDLYLLNSDIPLEKVSNFKYLGSSIFELEKDIKIRTIMAWEAALKLKRIWKNNLFPAKFKRNLFRATVETVLLYSAETWTLTNTLEKKLTGAYNKLYRYALNIKWTEKIPNYELFADLPPLHIRLRERRLRFAGHCARADQSAPQPVTKLLFWQPTTKYRSGKGSTLTYAKVLLKDTGIELLTHLNETMQDRVKWRKYISDSTKSKHVAYIKSEKENRTIKTILKRNKELPFL